MPYYVSNDSSITGCPSWAVIKLVDGKPETVACHTDKQSAVDQMVAVSLAEGMNPMGEFSANRGTMNTRILICDIDDTLIHNNRLIADVADFVAKQEVGIVLVTGRLESERAQTVDQLRQLGIDYDELIMNDTGSSAQSNEFKKRTAEDLLKAYDIVMAVDNNAGVREIYASLGIPVIDPRKLPVSRGDKLEPGFVNRKFEMKKRAAMPTDSTVEMAEYTKGDLALLLRDLLGDVVTFKFMAHGFHWNVRGVNFQQYHEFFGEIYEDADGSIDPIAENIRKLNFDAPFKLQDFIESAPESEPTDSSDPLEMCRSLYQANEDVRECIVKALAVADELEEQGIVNFLAERQDQHSKWQWQLRAIVGDSFARSYEIDVLAVSEGTESGQGNELDAPIEANDQPNTPGAMTNPDGVPMQYNSAKERWTAAARLIQRRLEPAQEAPISEERGKQIETRIAHADIELREVAGSDGMTFEGYASVFNSPSDPIGGQFTEYVAPGAFKRSLASRNDIKLLWNHDTGQVLGSTRAGTLKLVEDDYGLKAIATLPDTQLGRDAAVLLKRGDVANMSFGFTVPKGGDEWNNAGNVRTLKSVRLHEVSIVSFPAYQASTAGVRSEIRSAINVDELAESLMRLESGETLDADQANLIRDVVSKLTETVESDPTTILDLKQKALDLLLKK